MNRAAWRRDLQAVMVPWLVTRVVVVGALATVRFLRSEGKLAPTIPRPSLFEWDASFYRDIARNGYAAVAGRDGLRFFPLYPLVARLFGGREVALVVIANVAALAFLVLLRALARTWVDDRAAERSVWLAALVPGALATVMGYAEALYLLLAAVCFLALARGGTASANRDAAPAGARAATRAVAVVAAAGALAALTRPVGVLLAIPIAIAAAERRDPRLALAAAGPPLGLVAFLAWSARAGYGFDEPLRLQSKANLRGELVDPARALVGAARDAVVDHRAGPAMHLGFALAAVGLVWLAWQRLPRGPALYGIAALATALTSRNLDSFERYLLAAFPLLVAAAVPRLHRDADRAAAALLGGALAAMSVLVFTTAAIP